MEERGLREALLNDSYASLSEDQVWNSPLQREAFRALNRLISPLILTRFMEHESAKALWDGLSLHYYPQG